MKTSFRRSGFSLVELLTVIAIIAILAAIIFPVMTAVKERANQNKCMTNLQQIAVAIQAFKEDNRCYPDILGVEYKPGVSFQDARGDYLFAEYVKSAAMFHCPSTNVTNQMDYAEYQTGSGKTVQVYAYDSYDYTVTSSNKDGNKYTNIDVHYTTKWAPTLESVNSYTAAASTSSNETDYERQLRFRNPPGDTVVTWCGYHEGGSLKNGKSLVVFLDGHASAIDAKEVSACKWRIRPKS